MGISNSFLKQYYKRATIHKVILILSVAIVFVVLVLIFYLVQIYPVTQVSQFGINNVSEKAVLINQYRETSIQFIATLAQITGGVAIGFGIYYTWRRINIAEKELKVSQENQITERFTRAVDQLGATDQLGNPAIEIRLGGIYALERIANESDKDYLPIIEILTAYVRKNSIIEAEKLDVRSSAVQAILQVIRRRKYSLKDKEIHGLDFNSTYLIEANLEGVNLERADFELANFAMANLDGAILKGADLRYTNFGLAHLSGADLEGANLKGARNLTVDQLSKVKSLYKAKLDEELLIPLKEKYPALFDKPKE